MPPPEHSPERPNHTDNDPPPISHDVETLRDLYHARMEAEQPNPSASLCKPAVMPAEGSDTLTHVELGDIVRLKKPYNPARPLDNQHGPFAFGIVAEILATLPDGRTRNVSLYLYDPKRHEIFLGPNGVPEFVDHHCSEFELYKRATEQGYTPLVPPLSTEPPPTSETE